MGGNHYSARVFDKKHITASENSLALVMKLEIFSKFLSGSFDE